LNGSPVLIRQTWQLVCRRIGEPLLFRDDVADDEEEDDAEDLGIGLLDSSSMMMIGLQEDP